ncbi:uncharacterized protein SCHCODRAFT_02555545 [Schizophyllum commune H4-8]|uniref:Uncharacterized protein n=1 Tax=Schizophyllum commune (strain H4-8 / FGSC 9210) TaxID=578458 RepID=D8QM37_SCHCM|nr:uncharacterized protein SCHCODRAFT_02555545 [Schizophyllum commune H4-8]KAI5886539.1 hypothetical protein SCHCODRAFT_02555545 [Schizophyllum commune H4-8]
MAADGAAARVALALTSNTAATGIQASSPALRSWQTERPPSTHHYILGWAITDEMCLAYCRRGCPTDLHDGQEPFNEALHLKSLRVLVCGILAHVYNLPCASFKLVYADPKRSRRLGIALVLSDNQGYSEEERSLPDPALVDELKKELDTEDEPRWLPRAD